MDRIYCAEQIVVPPALPAILKAYTKEVIRYQPKNVAVFSRDYFAALSNGTIEAFLEKYEAQKNRDQNIDIDSKIPATTAAEIKDAKGRHPTAAPATAASSSTSSSSSSSASSSSASSVPSSSASSAASSSSSATSSSSSASSASYLAGDMDTKLVAFINSSDLAEYSNETFDEADSVKRDNQLVNEEVYTALQSVVQQARHNYKPKREEVEAFLKQFDADRSGSLSKSEFLKFVQQFFAQALSFQFAKSPPMAARIDQIFDRNAQNGTLFFGDIVGAVNAVAADLPQALRSKTSGAEVKSYMSTFPVEGRNGLSKSDFRAMIDALLAR